MTKTTFVRTGVAVIAALVLATAAPARAEKPLEGQALADRYAACWGTLNQKQWAEFEKCYAPSSVSVAPGLPPAKGAKAIVEKHAKPLVAAMPDAGGDIQLMLVSGRHAATVTLFHGTQTGPLQGPQGTIPPTNKKMGQIVAHAIESGPAAIAAKEWFIQDTGTMLAQLGIMQHPARPAMDKGWTDKPLVIIASNSETEKQNLALIKKLYAGFSKRDKTIYDLFADDIVDHDQAKPADLEGKAGCVAFMDGMFAMSSNIKVAPTTVFSAGDYTVAIGEFSGTNDGAAPTMGLTKATGKKFTVNMIEIARWDGGKLKEIWPFINGAQFAGQLGLIPSGPKTAQK